MEVTDHHVEKILDYKTLFAVLGVLFCLTALTIGVSRINLGILNVWVAMTVASAKGTMVLLFFMHMKYESGLLKISFVGTICVLAILIGFTFWDVAYR